ncbi:urease accessory protein UreD [Pseudomonas syringae pv. actinidiae ICMP 19079]|nr:urease accessory protein UreD [Pseudomonas syringae pv. actinidiae ICMP 19079]
MFATLLLTGDVSSDLLEDCRSLSMLNPVRGNLTQLPGLPGMPGLIVARCLADEALHARAWLIEIWKRLRPALLGREAVTPRIWNT